LFFGHRLGEGPGLFVVVDIPKPVVAKAR
jgi:hypothetical protein